MIQQEWRAQWGATEPICAAAELDAACVLGRVVSQERDLYRVTSEQGECFARVSGKFRYQTERVSDFPAVGDFVLLEHVQEDGDTVIQGLLPRYSIFIRKASGTGSNEQVVAANVDTVFLCMALNHDFNVRRLERYLSIAWDSGAQPVVVLTKADLCDDRQARYQEVEGVAIGADIVVTSALEQNGVQALFPYLQRGKTVAFLGSSGAGKSTLINCLLGEARLATNGLRNDDKGRHTTTHRELILLPNGALVMDTPGMRELGMWDSAEGIGQTFADIEAIAETCRFRNCTHTTEPGCAIRAALETGELSSERWMSYQKLMAENAYAKDSAGYLAMKEKKFRDIAKQNKKNRKK